MFLYDLCIIYFYRGIQAVPWAIHRDSNKQTPGNFSQSHIMGKSSGKSDDGGKEKKRKLAMAAEHQDENENDKGESPDASILRLTSSYVYLRR